MMKKDKTARIKYSIIYDDLEEQLFILRQDYDWFTKEWKCTLGRVGWLKRKEEEIVHIKKHSGREDFILNDYIECIDMRKTLREGKNWEGDIV